MKNLFLLWVLGILIQPNWAKAQLRNDQDTQKIAEQVLQKIYQEDFQGATAYLAKIEKKYPKHPVVPFLKAYKLSWERFPLTRNQAVFESYNSYLQKTLRGANLLLEKDKEDVEGIFFKMMVYSLLALHESEEGSFMKSVGHGKKAFRYMKKGFDLTEKYPDFHFSTGLYKYFAKQYPETHPIARPVMMFFPGGSRQEGLNHLNKATKLSRFSKVESLIFLHSIYAKYEQNDFMALQVAQKLVNTYPNHPFFWMKYCESLIQVGRYAEAEIYLAKFKNRSEKIYKVGYYLFQGWIKEKYYKSNDKAKPYYLKVVNAGKYDMRYSKDYYAFAYAGLGRISAKEGNRKEAERYYKKVLELAEYKKLKKEAKTYLKES